MGKRKGHLAAGGGGSGGGADEQNQKKKQKKQDKAKRGGRQEHIQKEESARKLREEISVADPHEEENEGEAGEEVNERASVQKAGDSVGVASSGPDADDDEGDDDYDNEDDDGDDEDDEDEDDDEAGDLIDLEGCLAKGDVSSSEDDVDDEGGSSSKKGKGKKTTTKKEEESKNSSVSKSSTSGASSEPLLVTVDFVFCDPCEEHFHGIKALLQQFLPLKAEVNVSALTDLLVAQASVGTVVSSESADADGGDSGGSDVSKGRSINDEGDSGKPVFAFISALPLQFHASNEAITAIRQFILKASAKAGVQSELEAALGEKSQKKVGLLVNKRMKNLPLQVVPKLLESLKDDMEWALQNEISQEHKDKFKFDYYLSIASAEAASGGGGGGNAMRPNNLYFDNFDEEVIAGEAEVFFAVPLPQDSTGAGGSSDGAGGARYSAISLIQASKVADCAEAIERMVPAI